MKNALLVLMAMFGWINVSNAQFGGAVLDNLKKKTTDKINQKVDETIDKVTDKTEDSVTQKAKKKKGNSSAQRQADASTGNDNAREERPDNAGGREVVTVVTPEGSAFSDNVLVVTNLVYSETTYDFEPNPNPILNGIGATLQQRLKKEKILIKIYQRSSGDDPAKAEEEYMAIKMYLVNRYDLNEDRIYFTIPAAKKSGVNRIVEFVIVPDSFMYEEAHKY